MKLGRFPWYSSKFVPSDCFHKWKERECRIQATDLPVFCYVFLSNVFFFTIVIILAQAFPLDLYLATFYISIVGALFIVVLSLIVLFSPKFWGIWKSTHKSWGEDGHPSQQNQGALAGGGGFGGAAAMGRMPGDIGQEHQIQGLSGAEMVTSATGAGGHVADPDEPLHTGLQVDRTFGSASSGAHRLVNLALEFTSLSLFTTEREN